MFMSVPTDPASVVVAGPAKTFRSSDWAERGFRETCGSALWYMTLHDRVRQLAAGLFENAAGNELAIEFYEDRTPAGYDLAGEHRRLSTEQTLALFAPEPEAEA